MATLSERLCRLWIARPDIDELSQTLELRADGTGSLTSGGGQLISLVADFEWTVLGGNQLRFEFRDTYRDLYRKEQHTYVRDPSCATHEFSFELQEGSFEFHVPAAMGVMAYKHHLVVGDSPLPRDAAKYHFENAFFTVVNQIDPRRFRAFYADGEQRTAPPSLTEVVANTKPWRECLVESDRLFAETSAGRMRDSERGQLGQAWSFRLATAAAPRAPALDVTLHFAPATKGGEGGGEILAALIEQQSHLELLRFREPFSDQVIGELKRTGTHEWALAMEGQALGHIQTPPDDKVRCVDAGGNRLAVSEAGDSSELVWNTETGAEVARARAPVPALRGSFWELDFTLKLPAEERLLLASATMLLEWRKRIADLEKTFAGQGA